MQRFETLCALFAECRKCRDLVPEIGALPENEFKFHWKPYLRGLPPLRFLFLGWEPSWPVSWDKVEEGAFSEPLQFAIREFLLSRQLEAGFMITNMAQCSMRTGPLCDRTRDARFTTCSEFLKEQILWARGENREIDIVAIGHQPTSFIRSHTGELGAIVKNCTIHRITHYSRKCNPHFRRFATGQSDEFDAFSEDIRPKYEAFIQSGEFHSHWQWYSQHPSNSKSDLERLFKWKQEMAGIRKS